MCTSTGWPIAGANFMKHERAHALKKLTPLRKVLTPLRKSLKCTSRRTIHANHEQARGSRKSRAGTWFTQITSRHAVHANHEQARTLSAHGRGGPPSHDSSLVTIQSSRGAKSGQRTKLNATVRASVRFWVY